MLRRQLAPTDPRRTAAAFRAAETMRVFEGVATAPAPTQPIKVIIVGAGMAGLCAAYELEQRLENVEIVLLEADPQHAGGRVRTQRFAHGLYGELGAMRIPTNHEITRHYVGQLGLTLRPFVQINSQAYRYVRGTRVRIADEEQLEDLFDLSAAERAMKAEDMWNRGVKDVLDALTPQEEADLSAEQPATARVRDLDQRSLRQLLEAVPLSEEAIEFLASLWGIETQLPSAAPEHLREELKQLWLLEFDEIVGGSDQLATAFVHQLRSKPRHGCEVIRLEQDLDTRRVAAVYREHGVDRREEGDLLLCTLPLPVLQRLDVVPAFSGPKHRAIRQVSYDSSTKVLAVAERRFWETEDGIYGGGSSTDLPIGFVHYPSDNTAADPAISAAPSVLLASYTWGMPARRLGLLPPDEAKQVVLRHLARLHPQLAAEPSLIDPENMQVWSWDQHRWSGGAFAWYLPGEQTALHRHVVEPEGRIYFAGEHASFDHTWIQGALASAVRAVGEMLRDISGDTALIGSIPAKT
jgi:monoamine oxidase